MKESVRWLVECKKLSIKITVPILWSRAGPAPGLLTLRRRKLVDSFFCRLSATTMYAGAKASRPSQLMPCKIRQHRMVTLIFKIEDSVCWNPNPLSWSLLHLPVGSTSKFILACKVLPGKQPPLEWKFHAFIEFPGTIVHSLIFRKELSDHGHLIKL
jgi:hypothetical protein